jgi:hypothetical protein
LNLDVNDAEALFKVLPVTNHSIGYRFLCDTHHHQRPTQQPQLTSSTPSQPPAAETSQFLPLLNTAQQFFMAGSAQWLNCNDTHDDSALD